MGFGEHEGRRGRAGCRRLLKLREREQGGKEGVRGVRCGGSEGEGASTRVRGVRRTTGGSPSLWQQPERGGGRPVSSAYGTAPCGTD
jgi:hypothetical protein